MKLKKKIDQGLGHLRGLESWSAGLGSCRFAIEPLETRMLLSGALRQPGSLLMQPTAAQLASAKLETAIDPVIRASTPSLTGAGGTNSGVTNASSANALGSGGYLPAQILRSYGIDTVGDLGGNGSGQTIAIIDADNDPTIQTDLSTFDAATGLSAPPNFWVVGQNGGSVPANAPVNASDGNSIETSLDVEWSHAVAPDANILLVEANSLNYSDVLGGAVAWVDSQHTYPNVSVVSMSFGGADSSGLEASYNSVFTTAGITYVASSGDSGAYSRGTSTVTVQYPAGSPDVLAVGGTTLDADPSGSIISEIGWGSGAAPSFEGSGGGISTTISQPVYQSGVVTQISSYRTVPDVSFDADPGPGVAVCDSYDEGSASPWLNIGGTSFSAPAWAGMIAIVNQQRVNNGLTSLSGATQTLPMIYGLSSSDFRDITQGSNGVYAAGLGYDLVTGRGVPVAASLIADLSGHTAAPDLTFSTPAGWTSPLAVTPTIGSRADGVLSTGTNLYVDWNGINSGSSATSGSFVSTLSVDGAIVQTLTTPAPLAAGAAFSTTDFSIGMLAAGNHTITITLNSTTSKSETNTANDIYTRIVSVPAVPNADLQPATPEGWSAPLVTTTVSGGTTDTLIPTGTAVYVDFAAENFGAAASGGYYVNFFLDGRLSAYGELAGLSAFHIVEYNAYSYPAGSLSAGYHTLTLVLNSNVTTPESNYTNDVFTTTFAVGSTGTITGTVFQDDNSNGTLDGIDFGLAGQTVYLDLNKTGVLAYGDPSTTTTTGGTFTFYNVPTGAFTLREVVPSGSIQDSPASSYSVSVSSGGTSSGYNFGNFPLTYTASGDGNTYTIQLSGSTFQLAVVSGLSSATYTAPFTLVSGSAISISAPGGDNILNVSGAGGDPVPSGGITFATPSGVGNVLDLIGSSAAYSFTANASVVLFGSNPINLIDVQTIIVNPNGGIDSLTVNAGTVYLPGQTSMASGLVVDHFSNLTVAAGASVALYSSYSGLPTDKTVLIVNALSLSSAGQLELNTNDAILHGGVPYWTIFNLLHTGYNGGDWNGPGIAILGFYSNSTPLYGIGSMIDTTAANFDSQTGLICTDILLKYTYYGDTNLSGSVDGTDYSRIDAAFLANQTHTGSYSGWFNGDFNYDGSIDGSDYTLIDNAFNTQGTSLAAQIAPATKPASAIAAVSSLGASDSTLRNFSIAPLGSTWGNTTAGATDHLLLAPDSDPLKRAHFSNQLLLG